RDEKRKAEAKSMRERRRALAAETGETEDASADTTDEWHPSMALAAHPYDPDLKDEDTVQDRPEEDVPQFAVLATFELKSVHQKGTFKVDLNKYTTDNLTLRFDENIGDMRNLMKEGDNFRQVNLDDPLYKQRELVVMVDGMNAKD